MIATYKFIRDAALCNHSERAPATTAAGYDDKIEKKNDNN